MYTDLLQALLMDKKDKYFLLSHFLHNGEISEAGEATCPPAGDELFPRWSCEIKPSDMGNVPSGA